MESADNRTSGPVQHKRQVKNYLIDRRFQFGWALRVGFVVSVIVGIMGYFLYTTISESIDIVTSEALGSGNLALAEAIIQQGQKDKFFTGLVLGSSLVGIVLILTVLTIVVTHRVAGPVYKMKKLFSRIDGESLQLWEKLRKGDELHDVFEEFSAMLRRLRESRYLDIEKLEKVCAELEKEGVPQQACVPLQEIIERYRQSVEMD